MVESPATLLVVFRRSATPRDGVRQAVGRGRWCGATQLNELAGRGRPRIATMFYENSTRTRVSFEVAAKWMSADTINVSASGSSVSKGESLRDTALTLRAAGADALIIRHPASGSAHQLAEWTAEPIEEGASSLGAGAKRLGGPSVINAGDGTHEHPTQALLDALTIRQRLGGIDGKRIVIVGDVLHSRVARSNVLLLSTLGAEVVLVAPPTLLPAGVEQLAGDGQPRSGRRTARRRRGDDAAGAGRADERRVLPVGAGVLGDLRAVGETPGAAAGQRRGAAPRPDAARHGDRVIGGRFIASRLCCNRFPTVCMCGWRCCSTCWSGGSAPRQECAHELMTATLLIRGVRALRRGRPGRRADLRWPDRRDRRRPGGRSRTSSTSSRRPVRCCCPASSTCTPICASRAASTPRPSKPVRRQRLSVATPRCSRWPTPNRWPTSPVVTDHVWNRGQQVGLVDVHPVGAVTVGLEGKQLTEMGMMADGAAQVRMFSDDGICVDDPLVMRRALEYATGLGVLIAQHAEEPRLTVGAVAHEGPNAARLGLAGWPRVGRGVDRRARRDPGRATPAPACTSATPPPQAPSSSSNGPRRKVFRSPPRSPRTICCLMTAGWRPTTASTGSTRRCARPADAQALRQALADGVIDCVATDHAPHAEHEKCWSSPTPGPACSACRRRCRWWSRPWSTTGLLTWRDVARVMSETPARIVGLPDQGRPLEVGEPANLTVIDPDATLDGRRRRPGRAVRQHAVRVDDAARHGHRHAAAREGHRPRREVHGRRDQRYPSWARYRISLGALAPPGRSLIFARCSSC